MPFYISASQSNFAEGYISPPPTAKLLFMDILLHTYPFTKEIYNATEYTSDVSVVEKHFTWLWEELPEWEKQCWIDEHHRVSSLYQAMHPEWQRNPFASLSILSREEESELKTQNALRFYSLEWFKDTVQRDSFDGSSDAAAEHDVTLVKVPETQAKIATQGHQ